MKTSDVKKINFLYSKRLNDNSIPKIKKIGWGSLSSQKLRFDILTNNLNLKNKNILDVGCGFGDLYWYITNKLNFNLKSYHGIDICEDFIQYDILKFKEIKNTKFNNYQVKNLHNQTYDFSFLSGSLNLKIENNMNELNIIMKKMFTITKKTTCINLLSNYVDFKNSKDYHYSPTEVFKLAKKITPYVTLRHDYPLYEFSIFLHR